MFDPTLPISPQNPIPAIHFDNPPPPQPDPQTVKAINGLAQAITMQQGTLEAFGNQIWNLQRAQQARDLERIKQSYAKDNAYSLLVQEKGFLMSYDKNGVPHDILKAELEWGRILSPAAQYNQDTLFVLKFTSMDFPLVLTEKQFAKPETLVTALERHLGQSVRHITGGVRKVGQLLQSYFSCALSAEKFLPYYGGWQKTDTNSWVFVKLYNGLTHGDCPLNIADLTPDLSLQNPLPRRSPSGRLVALQKVFEFISAFQNPDLSFFVIMVLHVSVTYTLLEGLQHPFNMGIYFNAPGGKASALIHKIFSCIENSVVSLSNTPADFAKDLSNQKDQPIILKSSAQNPTVLKNQELLLSGIRTGRLPLGRNHEDALLQALPVMISDTVSSLGFDASMIAVDVSPEDFAPEAYSTITTLLPYLSEHIENFLAFTEENLPSLQRLLDIAGEKVLNLEDTGLTDSSFTALADLLTVRGLLMKYCITLGIAKNDRGLVKLVHANPTPILVDMMQRNSLNTDSSTAICAQFNTIIEQKLSAHQLRCYALRDSSTLKAGSGPLWVYMDDRYCYFTRKMLSEFSQKMNLSLPTLLNALNECHILAGTKTNSTCYQTRKTVRMPDGSVKTIGVYMLSQDALGDYFDD